MILTLPYPISTNRYWRTFRNRQVVSAEATAYKRAAAWMAAAAGIQPLSGPVVLSMTLHPRAPKKARQGVSVRCVDIDNALKVAVDALNGVAYGDDAQIVDLRIRKGAPVEGGALIVEIAAG